MYRLSDREVKRVGARTDHTTPLPYWGGVKNSTDIQTDGRHQTVALYFYQRDQLNNDVERCVFLCFRIESIALYFSTKVITSLAYMYVMGCVSVCFWKGRP